MFWKCRVLFVRFLLASKDLRCKTQYSTFTVVLSFNLSLNIVTFKIMMFKDVKST